MAVVVHRMAVLVHRMAVVVHRMAVVVHRMAVAAVLALALALDSEPAATAAVERRLGRGGSNSTRPVAENFGASRLFPLAS
jgi:hypothetical protein